MPKPPDIEAVIRAMRESARHHAPLIRQRKPPLRLPAGTVDVTAQMGGRTFALIGAPDGKRVAESGKKVAAPAIDPEDDDRQV